MDQTRLTIIVLTAVAIVWSAKVAGLFGILVLALLGTILTIGLTTGSLAPVYPGISRAEAPRKYWAVMLLCGAIVVANILVLLMSI